MARLDIDNFTKNDLKNNKIHSLTSGEYSIVNQGKTGKIIQIDTFGSNTRMYSGKVSQSIQLDISAVNKLREIFDKEFPL